MPDYEVCFDQAFFQQAIADSLAGFGYAINQAATKYGRDKLHGILFQQPNGFQIEQADLEFRIPGF